MVRGPALIYHIKISRKTEKSEFGSKVAGQPDAWPSATSATACGGRSVMLTDVSAFLLCGGQLCSCILVLTTYLKTTSEDPTLEHAGIGNEEGSWAFTLLHATPFRN